MKQLKVQIARMASAAVVDLFVLAFGVWFLLQMLPDSAKLSVWGLLSAFGQLPKAIQTAVGGSSDMGTTLVFLLLGLVVTVSAIGALGLALENGRLKLAPLLRKKSAQKEIVNR